MKGRPTDYRGDPDLREKKRTYIGLLEELDGDMARAMQVAEISWKALVRYRNHDPFFQKEERKQVKRPLEWMQTAYLYALRVNVGNAFKARKDCGIDRDVVEGWTKDEDFKKRLAEVHESFLEDAREQVVRNATGRQTTVRDFKTLQWALAKWDPDYADKPKEVVHTHRLDKAELDDEILALTAK